MRTRTIKKEIIPYIVCAGLFALAGILQYIDNEVTIFWDKLLSLVINLIFFLLIFIWGNSAKNRIVQKSTRRLLIAVAVLMFLWLLLRYIKYYFFASYETASRYLWYLYYIPQCLVPPLAWIAAMGLTRKSSRSVCKCLYLVLVPAVVLILLILTNGSSFMKMIDEYCLKERISYIILSTEREYQTFNFYLKNNFKEAKQNVMIYKKIK